MSEETTAPLTYLGYSQFPLPGVCCPRKTGILQSIKSKTRKGEAEWGMLRFHLYKTL